MAYGDFDDDGDGAVYLSGAECVHETELAILVKLPGGREWIPKSQVHSDSEVVAIGDTGILAITEWFADKSGLG